MTWLKQSTAADVILGVFVDDTDFKTAETALSIVQADIRLSKNGAAFAQTNNVAGATHREAGEYVVPLDATDTNTLGRLRLRVSKTGALPVWRDFLVVPAHVYDGLVAGTDNLQVDAVQVSGTAQTARDLGAQLDVAVSTRSSHAAADVWTVGTRALTDKAGFSLSAAGIQAIWDALTSALTTVGSIGKLLVDNINATISSRSAPGDQMNLANGAITNLKFGAGAIDAAATANDFLAEINAEVKDVLETDTHAEPAAVPAATSSLKDKINWLFALARNKITQTATQQALRNDGDTANIAASTVSDDGTTFTRGEWA